MVEVKADECKNIRQQVKNIHNIFSRDFVSSYEYGKYKVYSKPEELTGFLDSIFRNKSKGEYLGHYSIYWYNMKHVDIHGNPDVFMDIAEEIEKLGYKVVIYN